MQKYTEILKKNFFKAANILDAGDDEKLMFILEWPKRICKKIKKSDNQRQEDVRKQS